MPINKILLFAMIGGALVMAVYIGLGILYRSYRARKKALTLQNEVLRRENIAKQEPGGHPSHPITIVSAAVVEPKASSVLCSLCQQSMRLVEHQVEHIDGKRLRVALVECSRCGRQRKVYFVLTSSVS